MRIVGREIIAHSIKKHANAKSPLKAWVAEAENAEWKTPNEITERFKSASFLGDDIVIFNIGGNKYRLEVRIDYPLQMLQVQWFGTHAEYSKKTFKGGK